MKRACFYIKNNLHETELSEDTQIHTRNMQVSTKKFKSNLFVMKMQHFMLILGALFLTINGFTQTTIWEQGNNNFSTSCGTSNANRSVSIFGNSGISYTNYTYAGLGSWIAIDAATGWESGSGTKGWKISMNTQSFQSLSVSFIQYSYNRNGNLFGPRDFKLQYSLDNSSWTDIGTTYSIDDIVSGNTTWKNRSLPSACDNQPSVYLRWIMSSNIATDGGAIRGTTPLSSIGGIKVVAATVIQQSPTDISLSSNKTTLWGEVGRVVGTLSTIDPNECDAHTYTLVAGSGDTDNAAYEIIGNSLRVKGNSVSGTSNTIRVNTNDGTSNYSKSFTINIEKYNPIQAKNEGGIYNYISNVTFNTINKSSTKEETTGYADYTGLTTSVNANSLYNLSIKSYNEDVANYPAYLKIWIDWNQNGNFDETGEFYEISGLAEGETTKSLNITIPATAKSGTTRMRITLRSPSIPPDPTTPSTFAPSYGNYDFGEAEDYSLNVITPPLVTSTSAALIGATTVTLGGNVTSDGGNAVIERGIVYSLSSANTNPQIGGTGVTKVAYSSGGTGIYSQTINSLSQSTSYHYNAYATNSLGTNYGTVNSFTTLTNGTFTGALSTDWATAGNWAGGSVPGSTADVIIPSEKTAIISPTTQASCKNLSVSGTLTIQSSSSNTGSLIVSGTATGNVNAERYLTGNSWHLVSAPASGQTVAGFLTANSNIPTNGSSQRGMTDYNTSSNLWNSYYPNTGASGSLDGGKGFMMRLSADGVVNFSGTLTSGSKTVSLSNNGEGWNCIGNPYTSAINMNTAASAANNFLKTNAIDNTNIDPSYCVYVWDDNSKTYKVLNNVPGNPRDPGINVFASGQAFFVKANGVASSVQFTPQMQVHSTTAVLKSAEVPWASVALKAANESTSSTALVYFHEGMTNGLDVTYDAGLLRGSNGLSVYTKLVNDNGIDFAIQCLPEIGADQVVIPVGLEAKAGGELKFSVATEGLPTGFKVVLEDRVAKTYTDLTSGASYPVSVSANAGGTGRFYLQLSKLTTGAEELLPEGLIKLKAYPTGEEIIIEGDVTGKAVASLFASGGSQIGRYNLEEGERNSIPATGLAAGVYILKVVDGENVFTTKLVLVWNK